MKTKITLSLMLLVWVASVSAQITRTQADSIVQEHIQNEQLQNCSLYVNINMPSVEGIVITTSNEETFKAKYACWTYYLNENPNINEPSQHRYLFVKEDDGNLLEVITSNDIGLSDVSQWIPVEPTSVKEREVNSIKIYPNPTTGELKIENGELKIESLVIFDIFGRPLHPPVTCNSLLVTHHSPLINISHLPSGVYFIKLTTEKEVITQKIIKQ